MSEVLKVLNNIRTLRAQAGEYPVDTPEEMLEKFQVVVKERREEESLTQAESAERARKLNARVNLISIVKCYWRMALTRMNCLIP